jgi:hypothetical protein
MKPEARLPYLEETGIMVFSESNAVHTRIFICISRVPHACYSVKCELYYPPRPSQSSLSTVLVVDAAIFAHLGGICTATHGCPLFTFTSHALHRLL